MDAALLKIFATEQADHVRRIRALLEALPAVAPETISSAYDEMLRRAHTLKGASRAVGVEKTEQMVHVMEAVFAEWRNRGIVPGPDECSVVQRALDAAEDLLAWALGSRAEPDVSVHLRALADLTGRPGASPEAENDAGARVAVTAQPPTSEASAASEPDLVRVNTALLDEVVNAAAQLMHATNESASVGRLWVAHTELLEETVGEYSRLRRNCAHAVRANARTPEFAPVAECLEYLDSRLRLLLSNARTTGAAQQRSSHQLQGRAEEVHDNACRARMTPAQTLFGAFGAMVRQLAEEEGKQVEYYAEGLEIQADRLVLEELKDPVMHLLRNAISHGVEKPEERVVAGKSPASEVRLRIASRGDRLRVTVEDNGKGLDTEGLSREAVMQGLMTASEAKVASPEALANLIFHEGVSTSEVLTPLAGRGLGLSIVARAVTRLQGDVRVRHNPGLGTRFLMVVPLTISTQHVLLIVEGGHYFGVPVAAIDQLCRFTAREVRSLEGIETVVVDGSPVAVAMLSDLLQIPRNRNGNETVDTAGPSTYEAIVVSSGDDRLAVVVEGLLDEREAVVRDSGLLQSELGLSAGAIPLEDGSVAVMLNVGRLLQRHSRQRAGRRLLPEEPVEEKKARLLVVDDSITTRSMEKSILEAHGYLVDVAVDGMEALEAIRANAPQLVISDINMPRMDGFQLLEKLKTDRATAHIPVILVTSLERPEEQEKGLALGADAYILKRKFDQRELLQIVRQIV